MKTLARLGAALAATAIVLAPAQAGLLEELDALRRIDRMPEFRSGTKVEQISSYDRTGGNDDGFSGRHSYLSKSDDGLVLADLEGPGVIERIWTPTPTDKLIEFYFDGETSPRISLPFIDLFSGKRFPFNTPVCGHEVGGYYCYVPIPYEKSCKIVYRGAMLQFHQIQYRTLAEGEKTETFPKEWSEPQKKALAAACELWSRHGEDVASAAAPPGARVETRREKVAIGPGTAAPIFASAEGGRIAGLRLSPASAFAGDARDILLRVTWDNEKVPAINCPVGDFFGFAFGRPAARGLLVGTDGDTCYCYLPMPFLDGAKLELVYGQPADGNAPAPALAINAEVDLALGVPLRENEGRLYASWRRATPAAGEPHLILDAAGRGHFVGSILQAQGLKRGMTLFFEGDDVTTIDGEMRLHGTGSEDFYNGGWYAMPDRWDEGHSLPLHGCLDYSIPLARTGGYRFNLADKVSFEKTFNLTIEHGGENNSVPGDYTSTAFYYADHAPAANDIPPPEKRVVYHPNELEYWLQLLPIRALSSGSRVEYGNWKYEGAEGRKNYETFRLAPSGASGFVTVELDVPATGEYEILLSYLKGPAMGRFRVYRRQEPVSEETDAYNANEGIELERPMGTAKLRAGKNSLTFRIEGKSTAASSAEFAFHRILLARK